ncbi:hypothetical protein ACMD2_12217 [Ananas comosus]|uniref:Uncharacterized protein n=1 Tax=Ananas comosus TaxID=4615 RepID=A0A199UDU2_ANACO|nr:hypothetical protein ACMD2_12217 [Ananas comosus]
MVKIQIHLRQVRIIDAQRCESEPIARITLPQRVPYVVLAESDGRRQALAGDNKNRDYRRGLQKLRL